MVEKNVPKINRPHKFDFSFEMEKSLNQLNLQAAHFQAAFKA